MFGCEEIERNGGEGKGRKWKDEISFIWIAKGRDVELLKTDPITRNLPDLVIEPNLTRLEKWFTIT